MSLRAGACGPRGRARCKAGAQAGLPVQPHRLTQDIPGARLREQGWVAFAPLPAPCPWPDRQRALSACRLSSYRGCQREPPSRPALPQEADGQ